MDRLQVRLRQLLSAAVMVVMACAAAVPVRAADMGTSNSDLIRSLLPTVVNISVKKEEAAPSPPPAAAGSQTAPGADAGLSVKNYVGSGFVVDSSGLILTNYHVVEDAFEVTVTFADGTRLAGKTLAASRLADLALVQVTADHPLPAVHWGNSDQVQVGDQVLAAGNPFGLGITITAGIVSALNRDIQNSPYDDLIQTDAPINHGNSGGPLFNMQGEVIGVDSTILSPSAGSVGLGFAIPASSAHFVLDQLRTYGWVHPSWIGVKVQTMTREMADALGMTRPEGSLVSWVMPDSPAQKAGLAIGDVILRFDDRPLSDERALLRDIAHTPVGNTITLLVHRDGEDRSIPIQVDAWPRNQWEARDAPTPVQRPQIVIPPDLGLTLAVPDTKEKAADGVLVTRVAPGSDPDHQGMARGDLILRVQNKPVATPAAVWDGVSAARAEKRDYVLVLVLPKVQDMPGPKWMTLRIGQATD
jgi:serine protease Do